MSIKTLPFALLILSLASAALSAEPALAGQWRVKSATLYGKPDPGAVGNIYRFGKENLLSLQYIGHEERPAFGFVDMKAKPWTLDIELDDDRREVGDVEVPHRFRRAELQLTSKSMRCLLSLIR